MKERLLLKYNSARLNLLIATALTVLNCFMFLIGSNWTFFFSTASPQIFIALAPLLPQSYKISAYVLSAVIIAALKLCYVNSKDVRRVRWLIGASIIFVLDALFSLYLIITAFGFSFLVLYFIFDLIILAFLLRGVFVGVKLNQIAETEGSEPADSRNNTEE